MGEAYGSIRLVEVNRVLELDRRSGWRVLRVLMDVGLDENLR
jgi:hypothetical protein